MKKLFLVTICAVFLFSCNMEQTPVKPKSASGIVKAEVKIKPQSNGLTIEQNAIKKRYEEDNKPGSLKHLYIISAFSGDTIIYSTVKGKVTSSGKRLTPYSVAATDGRYVRSKHTGLAVSIGGETKMTPEVLQDDGTYGSSSPYIYWWDSKGAYHQHYVTGGQIVHVSNVPMNVGKVIITID